MSRGSPFLNVDLCSVGARPEEITALMAWCKSPLPEDYLAFLRISNGADTRGDLAEYFRFWSVGDIFDNNRDYEVVSSLPEMIAIGDDGGPSMFLIDLVTEEIVRMPYSLDRRYARKVARSFSALLEHIAQL